MKRYLFWSFIIVLSLLAGSRIWASWRASLLSERGFSKESLLEATEVDPGNPEPFYKLSLVHQWSLLQIDLRESLKYLKKAIERNPLEQEYWLSLAKILQKTGDQVGSARSLENAVLVFPTGYQGRWIVGNLLLGQGAFEKAIPHFSYILSHYPNQSSSVYDVVGMAIDDPDFILENVVPNDASSLSRYLSYLYETRDKEAAKRAWEKKASLGEKSQLADALRHIEFLISQGDIRAAYDVWKAKLREERLVEFSDGNQVTNGGFEADKVLGGGFDWRIGKAPGVEISRDQSIAFEGRSSLRIRFGGKENVDFQNVSQYVPLKPNTNYLLRAHMKTRGITTRSGLKVEVIGVGAPFLAATEGLTGDNDWKELKIAFTTPAELQGGLVRVRKEGTNKFDRFVSGEAWIDNVQLVEIN